MGRCDIDAVVARLIKESVAAAETQGYVTGLGGAITLAKGMPILGGIAGGP
ncbi:hypothetical protein ABZS79_00440 [Streptomyces griseoloalbus]|uniref:hypothetical protein n=1 Tax=Streptomyces griseoloalbus TaxID=67303 RepID=UPI0033A21093